MPLQEVKTFTTVDELEAFILKHGENIVDLMGGEIDRIEIKLRVNKYNFSVYSFQMTDTIRIYSIILEKVP